MTLNQLFLFQIGPITISFSTLISFIVGVFIGLILTILIYLLFVISSLKSKKFFVKTENDDLKIEEVKELVLTTQKSYKDKELRGDTGRMTYCYHLSKDLAYAIAVRFYPKSKHPFLELSVNELTILTGYITNRVNELLNHRGIRMLRKLKVSTIVNISTKKKEVEESKAFQTSVVIGKNLSKAKYVFNLLNPINWGRKIIVDRVMNIVVDQICLAILSIVGEETYKIYSKKVFNKDVEIDTGSDEFIEQMSDTIKDAALEMDSSISVFKDNSYRLKRPIYFENKKKEDRLVSFDKDMALMKKSVEQVEVMNYEEKNSEN